MYLKRLEIQGFKTFAQKTVLEFMPDASGRRGVTAIVGPNGSGKSNAADAIRWVMGEQSLKLLRGKKSEDVIFSGTDKRGRSGFAEVTITIENDERRQSEIELQEIAITRRLYRDGNSEYEVNRQAARLQDVVLLLAQCGIGQRTYSVIGQGMIDQVLVSSPTERKEFFDEAFGLRPFQLKRQAALNKIEDAHKNLAQTEGLLREIGPRLSTLDRQVKRLQERDALQQELQTLERAFFGSQWKEISHGIHAVGLRVEQAKEEQVKKEREAKALEEELAKMEKAVPAGEGFRELQQALHQLSEERAKIRERQMEVEKRQAIAAVRAEKPWSPLPLSKIIESIESLQAKHKKLVDLLSSPKTDLAAVKKLVEEVSSFSGELAGKLQRPAPESEKSPERDPALEKELRAIVDELQALAARTREAEARLEAWNKEEEGKRSHVFELQHRLNRVREEARNLERKVSDASIELARIETRREGFFSELRTHAAHLETDLDMLVKTSAAVGPEAGARLQRIRSQLEWIGGIDPETVKEYRETKERFDFLSQQTEDLRESLKSLEIVVQELDTTIRERSATAFHTLNREFTTFFKRLFGGGDARLEELMAEAETDEEGNVIAEADPNQVAGIEIIATPPGKRFKSIALLSGGERALTSIALICAIMATNPSPFVVLDEVDAALDESNSRKFAEIIRDLADRTQFIVVTHNRATMTQANILYGVTMGDDGISQILSVKMEDVEKMRDRKL